MARGLRCESTAAAGGSATQEQDSRKQGRHGVWAVGEDGSLLGLWCRRGTIVAGEGALRSRRVGRIVFVDVGHIADTDVEIERWWVKRMMLARLVAVAGRHLLLVLAEAQRSKGRGAGRLVLLHAGGGRLLFCGQRQRPGKVDVH